MARKGETGMTAEERKRASGANPEPGETPRREAAATPAEPQAAREPVVSIEVPKPVEAAGAATAAQPSGGNGPEAEAQPKREGRLSRLRFSKKKDMPGGLWLKCEACSQVIYRKELEDKGRVCPECDFHFTVPGAERVKMVLDPDTWDERYAELTSLDRLSFVDKIPYAEKIERTVERIGQNEALLAGLGEVEGRRVVLAVLDFAFMGGSMGEVVGEKFALACELAQAEGVPLLLFTSSGGARMHEGIISLMQMAKTCAALSKFNKSGGLSICVLTHPTTGGVTASFASMCDLTLAEPGALIGFAGPRVIATTIKQDLPPGFQRAEFLLDKGQLDMIVRRVELREMLARLIDYGRGPRVE